MTLHIAPDFELPLDAVTETFAILAVKRAGKSNAAVVMAEEMYDAGVPWVAVDPKGDWWGVRAAGDGETPGLSVLVLGGLHGDIPLEPTAGKLIADLIAEERITCVLDVSEMTKADQRRFLTDFADRLYRRNTEPLHVFCEEADEYIPQRVLGEAAKLVGAFETLVKRGGFRGIGITLITQRSASLNKDVLTQAGTLIAMRTPSPQDRKAVLAWIDYHAASRDVVDELPMLEAGEAWVFSPQWLKALTKIRFRRRRTFDSGATPKVGGKPRPPATLADVDLAAIKEQMAETIEKAKADDPKELRKRIKQLERQLAERPTAEPQIIVETETVEVPVLSQDAVEALRGASGALSLTRDVLDAAMKAFATPGVPRASATTAATRRQPRPAPPAAAARPTSAPRATVDPDGAVTGPMRKLLAVLATYGPRTKRQLAMQAGYSAKGGGFNNPLSALRSGGYVERGEPIAVTQAGLDALGDFDPLPTGQALIDHWMGQLSGPERKILQPLIDAWPNTLSKEALADVAGYTPVGGGFNNPLSRLRTLELVTRGPDISLTDDFADAIA